MPENNLYLGTKNNLTTFMKRTFVVPVAVGGKRWSTQFRNMIEKDDLKNKSGDIITKRATVIRLPKLELVLKCGETHNTFLNLFQ